jgi:hypothetical protein
VTFGIILVWTNVGLLEDTFEPLPLSFVGLAATGISAKIDEPGRIKGSSEDSDTSLSLVGF